MKLSQIENLKNTLLTISQKELPFRLAYKISKLLDQVEKDSAFYTEKFRNIVVKYAERDEKGEIVFEGDNIKIPQNKLSAAEKELEDLNNVEATDINVTFTLDELEDLQMKPSELQGLLPFIEE